MTRSTQPALSLTIITLLVLILLPNTVQPVLAQSSMYAELKARQTGDIITIVLAERTAARRESRWENEAEASAGGGAAIDGGTSLSGRFSLDASFNKEALHQNSSLQNDLLSGTMTATIVDKDQAGNLVLLGERRLNVNGETHKMTVSGIVRPYDIQTNNTVLSYQIANASIEYNREGGITKSLFKPGALARLGLIAVIGGAIAFAASN